MEAVWWSLTVIILFCVVFLIQVQHSSDNNGRDWMRKNKALEVPMWSAGKGIQNNKHALFEGDWNVRELLAHKQALLSDLTFEITTISDHIVV